MTDRTAQEDDLLFEDIDPDDDSTVADTEEQETDSEDDRGSDDGEETPQKTQAEKQADVWAKRTLDGAELPENVKWLVKDFPEKFEHLVKKKPKKEDLKAIVRNEILKEQEVKDFNSMKKELNAMDLNASERELVDTEYAENRGLGLSQKVSLEKALKMLGNEKSLRQDRAHELAPQGLRREYRPKEKVDTLEAKLGGNLPKGWK